ncbi:conserved hypothetical protein [Xanthomonas oryzae pv. oryzae KACC 10331]|uniref:Uncharacterized protein n=1 Tax=Xanthomonas oryzae pv. oryzae (strain KACC10331 / KXO85) TaxID=291331 RepID=Q5H532_XANOR|nr:conserved hypothetical protein [Xanthomonas oryzae pv. oryzae KACC 10331]
MLAARLRSRIGNQRLEQGAVGMAGNGDGAEGDRLKAQRSGHVVVRTTEFVLEGAARNAQPRRHGMELVQRIAQQVRPALIAPQVHRIVDVDGHRPGQAFLAFLPALSLSASSLASASAALSSVLAVAFSAAASSATASVPAASAASSASASPSSSASAFWNSATSVFRYSSAVWPSSAARSSIICCSWVEYSSQMVLPSACCRLARCLSRASIGTGLSALPMVWPPIDSIHSLPPCRPMAATTRPSASCSTAWLVTWGAWPRRAKGRLGCCFLRLSRLALELRDTVFSTLGMASHSRACAARCDARRRLASHQTGPPGAQRLHRHRPESGQQNDCAHRQAGAAGARNRHGPRVHCGCERRRPCLPDRCSRRVVRRSQPRHRRTWPETAVGRFPDAIAWEIAHRGLHIQACRPCITASPPRLPQPWQAPWQSPPARWKTGAVLPDGQRQLRPPPGQEPRWRRPARPLLVLLA